MLGKLIKHDFKATGKVLIPLNLIWIAITIFGSILLNCSFLRQPEMEFFSVLLLLTYILTIGALFFITTIYLLVYYYRNMFSAQGYLTFTLPASPWSLLHAKMIVGFVWTLVSYLLMLISSFFLIWIDSGFASPLTLFTSPIVIEETGAGVNSIHESSVSILDILGYTPTQMILFIILVIITSSLFFIAMNYGSVTIGQLYAKHKIAGAVIAYTAIYFIVEILLMMVMFFTSLYQIINSPITTFAEDTLQSLYRPMFPTMIILPLAASIILYVVSGIILNRKVNLD